MFRTLLSSTHQNPIYEKYTFSRGYEVNTTQVLEEHTTAFLPLHHTPLHYTFEDLIKISAPSTVSSFLLLELVKLAGSGPVQGCLADNDVSFLLFVVFLFKQYWTVCHILNKHFSHKSHQICYFVAFLQDLQNHWPFGTFLIPAQLKWSHTYGQFSLSQPITLSASSLYSSLQIQIINLSDCFVSQWLYLLVRVWNISSQQVLEEQLSWRLVCNGLPYHCRIFHQKWFSQQRSPFVVQITKSHDLISDTNSWHCTW